MPLHQPNATTAVEPNQKKKAIVTQRCIICWECWDGTITP